MSGWNPNTGWTCFTSSKWRRYYRTIEGAPNDVDERFAARGIDFYWDKVGGVNARCNEGTMWEVLSGFPATFGRETAVDVSPQYLLVSDLAVNLVPSTTVQRVNRLLVDLGMQTKSADGAWTPTDEGRDFCLVCQSDPGYLAGRSPNAPSTYLRWEFAVLERVREAAARSPSRR